MADNTRGNNAELAGENLKNAAAEAAKGGAISDFVQSMLPAGKTTGDAKSSDDKNATVERNQRVDRIDGKDVGDLIRNHENPLKDIQLVGPDEKGSINLKTGDTLVRAGGNEILAMKDGGTVVVKPDGSYEINGKQPAKVTHDAGSNTTTLDMGNGRSVVIRDGRITEVTGDGKTAYMMPELQKFPKLDPHKIPHWEHVKPLVQGGGITKGGENEAGKNEGILKGMKGAAELLGGIESSKK